MKSVIRHVVLAAILLLSITAPASAQYMYLDANGDGVNTAADQLNANGVATTVDVWIDTDNNKDGSVAECNTLDGDMTINSYGLALGAVGGTVSYTNFINNRAEMPTVLAPFTATDTYMSLGQGGGTINPPGTYKLMTVTITGVSGAPAINIIPDSPIDNQAFTNFGTACSGNDFDNTYKLIGTQIGTGDFTDVDGLAAAAGANANPIIDAPANANGNENALLTINASATDPDGDNVTLSQTNDAPFLTGPASSGPSANPSISLSGTPTFEQAGGYTVNWSAIDDAASPGSSNASTAITIANVDRPPVLAPIADLTVAEGSSGSTNVSASDPDGNLINLAAVGLPAFATLNAPTSGNGSVVTTVSANPGFTAAGSYPVTINALANGVTVSQGFTIVVTNTNRPPVLQPITSINVNEGASASTNVSASDPDGDLINLTAVLPAFATLDAPTSGTGNVATTVTASPGFSDAGVHNASVTATDPGTLSDTENFTITVANVDQPVALQPISDITAAEGSSSSTNVSASDPDGDTINLSAVLPPFATLDAPTSGAGSVATTVTASPTAGDASGSPYPASVTATTTGSTDTENFQIIVSAGDQPPVIDPIDDQTVAEGANVNVGVTATDPDGGSISLEATLPAFAVLNSPTNGPSPLTTSITMAPGFDDAGSYPSSVTATSNGLTDTEAFTINVTNTNRAPVLQPITDINVNEGASASTNVSASDPDGDLINLSAVLPAFATLDAPTSGTGNVATTVTASPGFSDAGAHPASVTATDPGTLSDTENFSINVANVDRAPALDPIADVVVAEGASDSRNVNASDPDGDVVELSTTGLPAFATLNPPTSGTGSVSTTISINPAIGDQGTYPVSVTATAIGATDTESFTITVTETNQAIVLDPIADVTLDENSLQIVGVHATDADNDLIQLSASIPAFATLEAPTSGTGEVTTSISIAPGFSDAGSYPSSVTATDGIQPVTENFLITVNNVDRPVDLDPIADVNTAEGAVANVTLTATDPDGDAITFSAVLPGFGSLAGNVITLAPGFSDAGSYPASATATTSGSSDTENFTINVADTNRPVDLAPIADLTVGEGASATRNVSATDPDGDAITLSASLPAFASLTDNGDGTGSVTASPALGDEGTYPSSVTANSADATSDTENFDIIVTGQNEPPTVVAPATQSVDEGQNLNFAVSATDPDNDPLTLSASGTPSGASFTDNGGGSGTFDWTPNFTQAGVYVVTFTANDGNGGTGSASTEITVNNVNRCPTADANGPYSGVVNIAIQFNGTGSTDPDGDALSYSWTFGDGGSANGATPSHAYAADGVYTVILTVTDGICPDTDETTATVSSVFAANAFTLGGNKTTRLAAGKPTTCVNIEAVNGSFQNSDVDLATIRMISTGTGSVSEIFALAGKTAVDGDRNSNGVAEITACFGKEDLRLLFDALPAGNNTVTVEIRGDLITGGSFSAMLEHNVISKGGVLAASVSPNPLNPEGTLSLVTTRPGRVSVRVYDLNGRLVKTLLDESRAAGVQDVTWNGTNANGRKVASGVYFFRIDTAEGRVVKSVTVLK
jgi:PKD repeat protein